jgi:Xaa-Pro aminopeptidase
MRLMGDKAIAVLPAAPRRIRNGDVEYRYRQDSDFFYLTGFNEPDAVLVLVPGRAPAEVLLFCRERDLQREQWDGVMLGPEAAVERLGLDDAFPFEDMDDILPGLIEGCERIFFSMGRDEHLDHQIVQWMNELARHAPGRGRRAPQEIITLDSFIHELRLVKSAAELRLLATSCDIAAQAHCEVMHACRPGVYEYELEAVFAYHCRRRNADLSYLPIVAGGDRGCTLHYTDNQGRLANDDLLLIDAGAEYAGYASDITRTYPANGRFRGAQKALYELVLAAQQAAIAAVRPEVDWMAPHQAAVAVINQGLHDLGVLSGNVVENLERRAYERYFMHKTGHWLGLDVHDVGDYRIDGLWRALEPGMVLTVEPGVYFPPDDDRVPERLRGLAVRIEDDVVVTSSGSDCLSAAVPKSIEDVEACLNQ